MHQVKAYAVFTSFYLRNLGCHILSCTLTAMSVAMANESGTVAAMIMVGTTTSAVAMWLRQFFPRIESMLRYLDPRSFGNTTVPLFTFSCHTYHLFSKDA
jgi:hypothetical protein